MEGERDSRGETTKKARNKRKEGEEKRRDKWRDRSEKGMEGMDGNE